MRGLVAVCLTLAVAALSGCVELVEGEDPDVDAAAAEADRMLDEYNDKAGHIAGTVIGADGEPLSGALVDLLTVETARTDESGRFSFIDLVPGAYDLIVSAADHVDAKLGVEVAAGQFARPDITLEAIPAPEPYSTVHRFDGYSELITGPIGLQPFGCYCDFEGDLDAEGLAEVVVEAAMGEQSSPLPPAQAFSWTLDVWNSEDGVYINGYEPTPMQVRIASEDLIAAPDHFHLRLEPQADFLLGFSQEFTGYLTAFYHEGAPEGYTAFALADDA